MPDDPVIWRCVIGEHASSFVFHGEYRRIMDFPPEWRNIGLYLNDNPEVTELIVKDAEGTHVIIHRVDHTQLTAEQMWKGYWTHDYAGPK